ncbi:MAG TPA: DUF4956 domain-containing protein [bacterium]|nr:DUF4956 domain-containing protein [bacterium]HOX86666.1 DUF4956 domain-containing protein [bacterium]HPG46143.1 DUF4956 domain-containing protein [bacterium]HPM98228.1 DUF4956 domain-containing protein [bacterium]
MLNDFLYINLFPLSGWEIGRNILLALACGLFISWIYRKSYHGAGYPTNFVKSLILLTMITAIVLMVIGNNLARAFGLVGAMSIIRFRTAVKDTIDIVFIFFALAVGMAVGVGYFKIAILSTLLIGLIILILARTDLPFGMQSDVLLQFTYSGRDSDSPSYLSVLHEYCRSLKVVNARTIGESENLELSYSIRLKKNKDNIGMIRGLKKIPEVKNINLYFDEEEI